MSAEDLTRESAGTAAPETKTSSIEKLSKGNLVLVALFLAGIGGVYLLSLRTGPSAASAGQKTTENRVRQALTELGDVSSGPGSGGLVAGGKAGENGITVDTFYYEARQRQVPLAQLQCNPFVFSPPPSAVPVVAEKDPAPVVARPKVDVEAANAAEALNAMRLEMAVAGERPMAMISGSIYGEGGTVGVWTVAEIRPDEVVLEWKDQRHVLRIQRE